MIDTIRLGQITAIDDTLPVLRVSVQIPGSDEIETAVLWNNWGENSWPSIGSPCVVFMLNCNFAQKYAFVFNLSDAVSVTSGEKVIFTPSGNKITLKQDGSITIAASPSIDITASDLNLSGNGNIGGDCDVQGVFKVQGTQVVTMQQPAITPPTGGVVIDVEARAAIASIITTQQTHGLIA